MKRVSSRESAGMYVTGIRASVWMMMNGMSPGTIFDVGTPNMDWVTNMLMANGGVNIPMARLVVRMILKWTRSTPAAFTMGTSNGVRTRMADVGSMSPPTMMRKTLMASRMPHWGRCIP